MSAQSPILVGELGGHARSRTLSLILGAQAGTLPESGIALAFAREFQEIPERSTEWLQWCLRPGRLLVLLPPFAKGSCTQPVPWEARRNEPTAGGDSELARILARDRQHELRGELLPLERSGGQLLTGGWRRHPAAGLLLITTLPLWSLLLLEHRDVCKSWLTGFLTQAGTPAPEPPPVTKQPLGQNEWSILLHLCAGAFTDDTAALHALQDSSVFNLDPEAATLALQATRQQGFSLQGRLTQAGEAALMTGPYAPFARELKRMHHV